MAEIVTQEASRPSKLVEKLLLLQAFFCIAASAVGLVIILTSLCPGCSLVSSSAVVYTYWAATVFLFLLGAMTLALLVYCRRRQHSTTFRVAISSIHAEDSEETPAPTPHYNCASQPQQLDQDSSTHPTSLDLPDYFSVVQNAEEVSSENVPETPPPSYEEAIGIQFAFTQETIYISDEIFV